MSLWPPRRTIVEMVSVAHHERIVADLNARYDRLFELYTSLKLAGAVEVPKPKSDPFTESVLRIQPERDELKDLIAEKCGGNSRKQGFMLKALAADRANGMKDDDIRVLIEHGVEGNGTPI